ncbi:hypothetical protein [Streptomyces sp. NPDC013181]|uniref:hypothetical protein n=1 Tax=Streptomyces sp. NPDC013181 TaxID=3364864 RepID=UPI0036BB05E5
MRPTITYQPHIESILWDCLSGAAGDDACLSCQSKGIDSDFKRNAIALVDASDNPPTRVV